MNRTQPDYDAVPVTCTSRYEVFECEREAGHDGEHAAVLGVDEDGKADEAVSWK